MGIDELIPLRQIAGPPDPPSDGGRHVLVAGTIAAGKSTLTEGLAVRLGLPALAERPQANPFLERFYMDRRRWALTSQLWFVTDSARQHREIHAGDGAVQDHSIYENLYVFGATLAAHGGLDEDEWSLLQEAVTPIIESLPPPALVVLLEAPVEVLVDRVRARARAYEVDLDSEYLAELNRRRREYFMGWRKSPVLLVDSDALDLRKPEIVDMIASKVAEYFSHFA